MAIFVQAVLRQGLRAGTEGAVDRQTLTAEPSAVTAEAAGTGPVVSAIFLRATGRDTGKLQPTTQPANSSLPDTL
jgi:hypothetical protein